MESPLNAPESTGATNVVEVPLEDFLRCDSGIGLTDAQRIEQDTRLLDLALNTYHQSRRPASA